MRIIVAIVCVLLAAVCGFGFLASLEPGVSVIWRIAYAGMAMLLLIAAAICAGWRSPAGR